MVNRKKAIINGLKFERNVAFEKNILKIEGYKVKNENIFFKGDKVAEFYEKHGFYKKFLKPKGIIWYDIISKQLLPDKAIYVLKGNILYILEIKYQCSNGSVDEKLQTCRFKKLQYKRLLEKTGLNIQFYFVLSDFFLHPKYKDVLNFIRTEGCDYFFGEIPLDYLQLP